MSGFKHFSFIALYRLSSQLQDLYEPFKEKLELNQNNAK